MVRAAIIAPDSDIRYQLEELLAPFSSLQITRRWEKHPSRHDLARFLRATATQLLIVSIEELDSALKLIEHASSIQPGLQLIAVDRHCDVATLQRLLRLGVREFVSLPATIQGLQECLVPLLAMIEKQASWPTIGSLFTFLPAKSGSGASTTALNVSNAMAGDNDRVLLADFDLNNGVLDLMLNLKHEHSVVDALKKLEDIDQIWPELVSTYGKLDVLPIDERQRPRFELDLFRQLVEFVRSIYEVVCIDLPGNMDELEIDVLNDSTRILLVSAMDIPSLHLARKKLSQLERMELADRVEVVLNEASNPYRMRITEAEQFLGRGSKKISFCLPADARAIHEGIRDGMSVSTDCVLGAKYRQLADSLLPRPTREREASPLRGWFKRASSQVPAPVTALVTR